MPPQKIRLIELGFCLVLGAAVSIALGQDCGWDLRNYHLYNPINLLQGRFDLDFFPADKQMGINPLLDVIYAYLSLGALSSYPRVLAALMGCWYGLLIFASLRIADLLFAPFVLQQRRVLVPLSTLIAATGAMEVSQVGTTSNDVAIASLIMSGLWCVLRTEEGTNFKTALLLSGFLFGLAAGAKLTGIVYAPALLVALVVVWPWRQALRGASFFSIGWLTGFLPLFGSWGLILWNKFSNPVFPLFNEIFQSPLVPPANLSDLRFLPQDLMQKLAYPFYWAWDASRHPVYETNFSDPRLALAYIALGAAVLWSIRNVIKKQTTEEKLTSAQKIAAVFLAASYVLWLETSSILRYAVALESLSALVAVAFFARFAAKVSAKWRLAPVASAVLLGLLCLTATHYPDLTRRPFEDKVFKVDLSWAKPDTMFIGVYEPFAYLAAFVPPDSHDSFIGLPFISAMNGWPLGDIGTAMVRVHQGPVVVVFREDRGSFLRLLSSVGLSPMVTNCRKLETNLAPADGLATLACDAFPQVSF